MKHYPVFVTFVLFMCLQFIIAEKYCYDTESEPYLHFATKTSYEFVYGKSKPEEIPGCEPVQIWMLARHGTRNPSKDELGPLQELNPLRDEIIRNHDSRKNGQLCVADRENLQRWQLKTGKTMANTLAAQGRLEMEFLAKRMRSNFPSLFREGYSEEQYVFRHTQKDRTKESAEIFAKNLFGHNRITIPAGVKNDPLIKSYSSCHNWEEFQDKPDTFKEVKLFQESNEVLTMIQNVSQRLGYKYNLTLDKIDAMYDMCRYDKAWNLTDKSPWCAVFSKEELMILEYLQDLKFYYEAGYGHEINIKLGCPLVKDMVQRFRLLAADLEKGQMPATTGGGKSHQPRGIFYFSHTKALLMLLSRLGIAQDAKPLTHADFSYNSNRIKRDWQTSLLSPFSANLAVVFYNCPGSRIGPQVMMYLQEKRLDFKGCSVGLCSWRMLEEKLAPIADQCDLRFCEPGWSNAPKTLASPLLLLSLVTLLSPLYYYL